MEEELKGKGPENSGPNRKKKKGRGGISPEGGARLARYAAILVGVLVLASAYALATGRDIPASIGSIVTVLLHAVMGI